MIYMWFRIKIKKRRNQMIAAFLIVIYFNVKSIDLSIFNIRYQTEI